MLQKVRKQGIRLWDERTFWHEIIYKSLIPTFGSPIQQKLFVQGIISSSRCNKVQNVTGTCTIIMLVYRRLLTTHLHGEAAV